MSESLPASAPAAWRTVLVSGFVALLQTGAFAYGTHHGWTAEGAMAFGSLCVWSTTVAIGQAFKALGEHLGNGSGIKGAIAALTSDTKPGEAP